ENEFYVRNYLPVRLKVLTIYRRTGKLDPLTESIIKDDELIVRITNCARQAREFYDASKSLPLLTKPILVMYTFEKLAELLVLTTFDFMGYEKDDKRKKYTHGVHYEEKDEFPIQVKPNGLFSFFHDCHGGHSPKIYEKQYS